jgi:hypothetical protein
MNMLPRIGSIPFSSPRGSAWGNRRNAGTGCKSGSRGVPFSDSRLRRRSRAHRIFPAAAALLLLTTVVLATAGCGIASYPYLVPPKEAVGVDLGFQHQSQVNPSIFQGYEIYYRIYDSDVNKDAIMNDLSSYLQDRSGFEEVSVLRPRSNTLGNGDTSSVDNPYWLAVASKTTSNPPASFDDDSPNVVGKSSPPIFPMDSGYSTNEYDVELTFQNGDTSLTIVKDGYPSSADNPEEIYLFRRIHDDSNYVRGFTTDINDYSPSDHADVPDGATDELYIAFFSIIYGYDASATPIFANSQLGNPQDNIVYMGTHSVIN